MAGEKTFCLERVGQIFLRFQVWLRRFNQDGIHSKWSFLMSCREMFVFFAFDYMDVSLKMVGFPNKPMGFPYPKNKKNLILGCEMGMFPIILGNTHIPSSKLTWQ